MIKPQFLTSCSANFKLLLALFFIFNSTSVFANETNKKILDNGLTVLISEMPSNPVVSVYALVRTGSATEGEFLGTGISHFLEHMLFKGTDHRAVGEIAAQVQAVGGTINASTGKDYTIYTVTVPLDAFDTGLDIVSDMIMNTVFEPEEIEKEREVIYGEMRLRADNPDRRLSELVYKMVYINHPYKIPIIGYKNLLAKVSKEDLTKYYQTHYIPNNTILSIAGDISFTDVMPKIKETFKNFERQIYKPRNLLQDPPQLGAKRYEEQYPTDLTRMSLSFRSVRLLNKDLFALDVLAKVLGQGRSSRLHKDIFKEKHLVHRIQSYNYTPVDQGLFEIEALLDGVSLEQTVAAIWSHIDQIKKDGFNDDELEKAKRQVLSEHIFAQQTTSQVAYSAALDEAVAGDYAFSDRYIEGIKNIQNADIKRVAGQYLNKESQSLVILKPISKEGGSKSASKNLKVKAIHKHVLENGLRVLLKQDNTFPLISMRMVLNGGLRFEQKDKTGLSKMMTMLWTKGTKSRSANRIAEEVESLGMRLNAYAGKNSLGLEMELLAENFKEAFDLFSDIAFNPSFPDQEIEETKTQMLAGLKQQKDDISHVTGQRMKELLFKDHPYRYNQLGTEESIQLIGKRDINDYYRALFVPSNVVLAIYGDFDEEEILRQVTKVFGKAKSATVEIPKVAVDALESKSTETLKLDKQQAMVMMGFHGVPIDHPDRYGLEVLLSVLGSPFNGRLFKHIREELGQAYTVGGVSIPGVDTGYMYLYVLTTQENAELTQGLLMKEIKDLQTTLVDDKDLNDTKMYLKGTHKADLQTNHMLSFSTSLDELYGLGHNHYVEYDENINQIKKETLKELAQKYLNVENSVVVTTLPTEVTQE